MSNQNTSVIPQQQQQQSDRSTSLPSPPLNNTYFASSTRAVSTGSTMIANSNPSTSTMTITNNDVDSGIDEAVLRLTLQSRPTVTWDDTVQDNEGMGRKSSKRCCIFHKQRMFGESSTDSSDDSDDSSSSSNNEGTKKKKSIARRKKTPDYQRHHA